MDSAGRNFLGLASSAALLGGYGVCAVLALAVAAVSDHVPGGGSPLLAGLTVAAAVSAALVPIGRAFGSLRRQARASRRFSRQIRELEIAPGGQLREAAAETGLGRRVSMLDTAEPHCFVHGILSPRVAISRGLVERLDEDELRAVLRHELYHVRHADPLKRIVGRALAQAFFLVPLMGTLLRRYEVGRELAADRQAIEADGPRSLAGALLKTAGPAWSEDVAAVSFGSAGSTLDSRLVQIERGRPSTLPRTGARELLASAMGASGVLALIGLDALRSDLGGGLALCVAPLLAGGVLAFGWLSLRD